MGTVNPSRATTSMSEGTGQQTEANALTTLINEFNGNIDGNNINAAAALALSANGITLGGDVNLYRSAANVAKTDDTLAVAGTLQTFGFNPALAFLGDADGAKWLTKLGGFQLVFASDNGSTASLGTGDTTYVGRTFKPKAALTATGDLNLAGDVTLGGQSVRQQAGLNDGVNVRRGAASIATAESTSSTAYTLLTTADRVQNVVLPTNGFIVVAYQAIWQNTVGSNARAAIFLGATQTKLGTGTGAPGVAEGNGPIETNDDAVLATNGLQPTTTGGVGATTEVATGQVLGSNTNIGAPVYIWANAGTYDVSVQFKNNAAGTLTVKNRHLWVWTIGF